MTFSTREIVLSLLVFISPVCLFVFSTSQPGTTKKKKKFKAHNDFPHVEPDEIQSINPTKEDDAKLQNVLMQTHQQEPIPYHFFDGKSSSKETNEFANYLKNNNALGLQNIFRADFNKTVGRETKNRKTFPVRGIGARRAFKSGEVVMCAAKDSWLRDPGMMGEEFGNFWKKSMKVWDPEKATKFKSDKKNDEKNAKKNDTDTQSNSASNNSSPPCRSRIRILSLMLAYGKKLGEKSPYHDYLEHLPNMQDFIDAGKPVLGLIDEAAEEMGIGEGEMGIGEGERFLKAGNDTWTPIGGYRTLIPKVSKEVDKFALCWEQYDRLVNKGNEGATSSEFPNLPKITWKEAWWGFLIMETRSFTRTGTVPLLDLLNTGSVINGKAKLYQYRAAKRDGSIASTPAPTKDKDGKDNVLGVEKDKFDPLVDDYSFDENTYFCYVALKPIKVGEELLNDYGQDDRGRLNFFLSYGAVLSPYIGEYKKGEPAESMASTRHFCINVLSRGVVEKHNIWVHQNTNKIAWNLARWAELHCEQRVRVVNEKTDLDVGSGNEEDMDEDIEDIDEEAGILSDLATGFGGLDGIQNVNVTGVDDMNEKHTTIKTTRDIEKGEPIMCLQKTDIENDILQRFRMFYVGPEAEERRDFFMDRISKGESEGGGENCVGAIWLAAEIQQARGEAGDSNLLELPQLDKHVSYFKSLPTKEEVLKYHPGGLFFNENGQLQHGQEQNAKDIEKEKRFKPSPSLFKTKGLLGGFSEKFNIFKKKCLDLKAAAGTEVEQMKMWQISMRYAIPGDMGVLNTAFILWNMGRGKGNVVMDMLKVAGPSGEEHGSGNAIVMDSRFAQDVAGKEMLEKQERALQKIFLPPPGSERKVLPRPPEELPGPLSCVFATKDIPKNTPIVAEFRKTPIDWFSGFKDPVPLQTISSSDMSIIDHFSTFGEVTEVEESLTIYGSLDKNDNLNAICEGLGRGEEEEMNVWKHRGSNGIADTLAMWAEVYCQGRNGGSNGVSGNGVNVVSSGGVGGGEVDKKGEETDRKAHVEL